MNEHHRRPERSAIGRLLIALFFLFSTLLLCIVGLVVLAVVMALLRKWG